VSPSNGIKQTQGVREQVARKTFDLEREYVTREWRKYYVIIRALYKNIRAIKLRRVVWAGHVAREGEMRHTYIHVGH
jgi:tRNA A22 N-methylase